MLNKFPQPVIADTGGKIHNLPSLVGAGMKGDIFYPPDTADLIPLPECSQLFLLPDRMPVAFDPETEQCIHIAQNPLTQREEPCFPVAAFLAPGYTGTFSTAFLPSYSSPAVLPLFAYTAVFFYKNDFYVPAVRVDRERRQDPRLMDMSLLKRNVKQWQQQFPANRLMRHLENCALVNGCPAAKNFFLQRYEAPLPTSPSCNARCVGCISYQPEGDCPVTQPRIEFVPTPEEVAEVALHHIRHVADPVVSFGQGCEGEPLMAGDVLIDAVRLIRARTSKGMINLNTNASRPDIVEQLCCAGLDSIRVSLNSVRPEYYDQYYRPQGYAFRDIERSIRIVKKQGGFVSLNYLVMPGFTDSRQEFRALKNFIKKHGIDMIQWRNMNFDPQKYFDVLQYRPEAGNLIGIGRIICDLHTEFPGLMRGYFNPSRRRIHRFFRSQSKSA
ncbi:MAG: radical SAM protein [Candidatus Omnitrophota bacterium]